MTSVSRSDSGGDDRRISEDLAALERRSASRVRPLDTAMRAAREGERAKGAIVIGSKNVRARWAAVSLAAAAVLVLLLVPFSHEAVTAYDLTLDLSGPAGAQFPTQAVAGELGSALGVVPNVGMSVHGDEASVSFTARVPRASGVNAQAVGDAFATALRERGYRAAAHVEEHREHVSGTLYAMARENLIEVNGSGKTDAEVEAEIVSRLADAGIPGAEVSVARDGDDVQMEISMPASPGAENTTVVLTSDQVGGVRNLSLDSVKETHENGALVLEVANGPGTVTARVEHPETLTDQQLADAVLQQLTAQGMSNLSVSAQAGKVTLIPMDKLPDTRGASWSEVKKLGSDQR